MQKSQQAKIPQQKQQSPTKQQKINDPLQKYLKNQRTFWHQYQIVKQMLKLIQKQITYNFETFKTLYNSLSSQIKQTILFCKLNYNIWNDEAFPLEIRQKTQFFKIVSEWIVLYELKVGDLKNTQKQIQFLNEFFSKHTNNIFEKVVLFDEISQDLVELLGRNFWGIDDDQSKNQRKIQANKEEAAAFLKFLSTLIEYQSLFQSQKQFPVHHCQYYLLRKKSQNYKQFIFRSLQFILNVNNNKKPPQKCLEKHQQMQLTRIALIFLQRPDIIPEKAIKLLQLMMLKTAKPVRYAMVIDYVRYYDYLQKAKQYQILQELQNMVYFRQLIIGQSQVTQSALYFNPMSSQSVSVMIASRHRHRILLSHQPQLFGKYSILQLEFIIQAGDITVNIYCFKNNKQTQYWKQQRTQDRRVDILLMEEGLYIVQFDNSYSWVKGKKVSYRIQQYCAGFINQDVVIKQGQ